MTYIDGFVAAVPVANKQAYLDHAQRMAAVFTGHGASRVVETWGDDVPEGKLTSFTMAVKREEDEHIVFSWIEWPSKQVRDEAWAKVMEDERMRDSQMPFDGKRMIYGGFAML
ncbi:MAG TPA: DUF1428 domain-containing protein, partial [Rhizobiaceae bacterium]|nr:DUF1428 domain-containing protein [Rhizobiaceae bacterium]